MLNGQFQNYPLYTVLLAFGEAISGLHSAGAAQNRAEDTARLLERFACIKHPCRKGLLGPRRQRW